MPEALRSEHRERDRAEDEKSTQRLENGTRYMAKVCLKNVTNRIPALPAIATCPPPYHHHHHHQ